MPSNSAARISAAITITARMNRSPPFDGGVGPDPTTSRQTDGEHERRPPLDIALDDEHRQRHRGEREVGDDLDVVRRDEVVTGRG